MLILTLKWEKKLSTTDIVDNYGKASRKDQINIRLGLQVLCWKPCRIRVELHFAFACNFVERSIKRINAFNADDAAALRLAANTVSRFPHRFVLTLGDNFRQIH